MRLLKPVERINFRVTHGLNWSSRTRRVLTKILSTWGTRWVEFLTANIVQDHSFANFEKIDPKRAVLLVANHRSFNDQFVIASRLFKFYGAHHNVYFPIRANFFYDNPIGLLVNFIFASGVMYPPFVRDRKRLRWNQTATDIMVELLKQPENMIGFHPEGTRNLGPDPYELLPAKPGCGELIYRANPNVIPVFLQGFPPGSRALLKSNFGVSPPLVHMVMGEPLDLSEFLDLEPSRKTYLKISQKVMAAIVGLAMQEKTIRACIDQTRQAPD